MQDAHNLHTVRILISVIPAALGIGFIAGFAIAFSTGQQPTREQLAPLQFLDTVLVLAALITVMAIGFATGKAPVKEPSAPLGPALDPSFRPADPNNPYASPQDDER